MEKDLTQTERFYYQASDSSVASDGNTGDSSVVGEIEQTFQITNSDMEVAHTYVEEDTEDNITHFYKEFRKSNIK